MMIAKAAKATPIETQKILSFIPRYAQEEEKPKEIKLKKDGTPKKISSNKKKGKKSEVYAFQIEDIKKMHNYFEEHEMWIVELAFTLGLNLARRVGDTLSLTWEHLYNPQTGNLRKDIEISEDKTDKLANPHLNSACRKVIEMYIEKTGVNPADNNYQNPVFIQTTGNYKGNVLTEDGYRKALKRVAAAVGIEYNVGTHSTRKTFGMLTRTLHPNDYDSMQLLQSIFNHSDEKTTRRYIGLTKQKVDTYYDDLGAFYDDYITGDKTYTEVASSPIVSLDTNDLRDIIKQAYSMGIENAQSNDAMIHVDAVNDIMALVEQLAK